MIKPVSFNPLLKSALMATAFTSVLALAGCNSMPPSSSHSSDHSASDMSTLKMLTDVTWQQMMTADEKPNATSNPFNQPSIHFSTKDRRFSGSDGCNRIMGTYEADANNLKLGAIAGTKMACSPQDNVSAQQFVEGLSKTTMYQVKGSSLLLQDSAGNTLLMLHKVAS